MKLALAIPDFLHAQGGAEKVAARLACLLAKEDHEVTVFCQPADTSAPPYILSETVHIQPVAFEDAENWQPYKGQFDGLIAFVMGGLHAECHLIARWLGAPLIMQECTNPLRMVRLIWERHHRHLQGFTLKQAFWLRQSLLAHCHGIRLTQPDYLKSLIKPLRPYAHAFFNGLEPVLRSTPDMQSRPKRILALGALKNPNKNGLMAAEAFLQSGLWKKGWMLQFHGHNAQPDALNALQGQPGGEAIYMEAEVEDLPALFDQARLLCLPSKEEGLPNVIVEAFSNGVPVIGFQDCEGTRQILQRSKAGRLVRTMSPDALATDLKALATDTAELDSLSRAATRFARAHLTRLRFEKNWLTLIETAFAQNSECSLKAPLITSLTDLLASHLQMLRELSFPVDAYSPVEAGG
ncbi:glycosyltransferase [Hyphobacterium sp. CCMP332]|uniref:glycosyltransferase n=1 Tax=Hyphobacterium sp. CCMP332 TaxID=2749086 RepID=UPI00164EE3BE|nr:glycosyltransferase [Hyphobacterium sp. CCMP332]QNL17879.1 glycosyltransferase [Hyphobacterium sp. CCMP332]